MTAFSKANYQKIHYLIIIIYYAFVEAHLKLNYHDKNMYGNYIWRASTGVYLESILWHGYEP